MKKSTFLAIAGAVCMAGSLSAAVIITPTSILSTDTDAHTDTSINSSVWNLINDTGTNPSNGLSFAVTTGMDTAQAQTATIKGANNSYIGGSWITNQNQISNAFVIFDLGQTYTNLDSMMLWQYNLPGAGTNQVKNLQLQFSTTGTGVADWGTAQTVAFALSGGGNITTSTDLPAQLASFNSLVDARYVKMTVVNTQGGNRAGIAEIRFAQQIPEPSTYALFGAGLSLGAVALVRRRKQK